MKSSTFGFKGAQSQQPGGFFKRNQAGGPKATIFGVTGADGDAAIKDQTGSGEKTDSPKRGVQIADPTIAGCVVHLQKHVLAATGVLQYLLSTREPSHHESTVLVVTRPPQYVACRMTTAGAEHLPIVLQSTATGDGACAAVYGIIQTLYLKVCAAIGVSDQEAGVFTARGKAPSVHDNSLLWDLPSLDPETCMSKYASAEEDGMMDMLAWCAWHNVDAMLGLMTPQLLRGTTTQTQLGAFVRALKADLEVPLHTGLEERFHAVALRMQHLEALLEDCMRLWRGEVVLAATAIPTILPEAAWPDLGDTCYQGAVRLCVAQQRNPVVTPKDLLRAAVWLHDAAEFLQDVDVDTGMPIPTTMSEGVPLETLAFAGLVGFYCIRHLNIPPPVAKLVADVLCGGSRYLRPRDRTALQQFAVSAFAGTATCHRLGWVAEWSHM
jgi:hypothetical protein